VCKTKTKYRIFYYFILHNY